MAHSSITKQILADSFKELLEIQPFSKISIADICERCNMNRKSFYYHFKDKYDLVNWIFYNEFIVSVQEKNYTLNWDFLKDLCSYFYENQNFYRKTFTIVGQNSFSNYFHDIIVMILTNTVEKMYIKDDCIDFYINFYSDAFFCVIKKWILDKGCTAPDIFVQQLKTCLLGTSYKITREFTE